VSWLRALRTVLSAFFGIRRGKEAAQDVKLPFRQVLLIALLLMALFIALLAIVVHLVV
jgi:hypothetical protein